MNFSGALEKFIFDFFPKSLRSPLCNHHQRLESLSFKVRALGILDSDWSRWIVVATSFTSVVVVNCEWVKHGLSAWALTNSEFNLFFKASAVISLQTTTASRTPSDESEYILTLFSVSQSYFLVFWNVARFICSYVSSFLIITQHCPVLRSLNLLKFIYFHICILIKYWTGESLKCI